MRQPMSSFGTMPSGVRSAGQGVHAHSHSELARGLNQSSYGMGFSPSSRPDHSNSLTSSTCPLPI